MADAPRREIFYKKTLACLLDGAAFDAHRIYPSVRTKYERLDEYLDVPYYDTAATGEFCNNLLMEVRVCPRCGFASNDDAHFKGDQSYVAPIEFEKPTRNVILKQSAKRLDMLKNAPTVYQCPRAPEDAVTAYKVAILTSSSLYNAEPRRFAGETVRLANYALKLARIAQEQGQPEMREGWRRAAYEYLTKSFEADVKGVTRYRGLYQLSALAVYFNEDKTASKTFELLRRLAQTDPDRDLHRYLNRVRNVWDNRDLHRRSEANPTS